MGFILETEIYRSQRYNYEFSIVFIDLDHFQTSERYARAPGGFAVCWRKLEMR